MPNCLTCELINEGLTPRLWMEHTLDEIVKDEEYLAHLEEKADTGDEWSRAILAIYRRRTNAN